MSMHFLAWCLSTPWALKPEQMTTWAALLARRYAGGRGVVTTDIDSRADAATIAAIADRAVVASVKRLAGHEAGERAEPQAAAPQRVGQARAGAIAVIPVYGAIVQRASQLGPCEGGTSVEAISKQLRAAQADDSVGAILLDIDSPGGSVFGVSELAADIRASAKPVTAIANSLAASAAYWLGTAASEFWMTPGGEVGSIGVWMAHEDVSKALEQAGIDVTLISAGKYKVEGNPYGPLDADAKAFLQSRTDDYYAAFTRDVAKGRKVSVDQVRGGMGQGRVLGAAQAKAENMVDQVGTFDQVIRHMQRGIKTGGRSALAAARNELSILG